LFTFSHAGRATTTRVPRQRPLTETETAEGGGLVSAADRTLLRHTKLSKNLEQQRRTNCTAAMPRDGHGPSVAVQPAFVVARLATLHEAERQRRPLELARRRARHARFQSCPSEAPARGPDTRGKSTRRRARVRPEPPRACPSTRSSLPGPGSRPPRTRRLAGTARPCNRQAHNWIIRLGCQWPPKARPSCPDPKNPGSANPSLGRRCAISSTT
jgi:hypothetical protein